MSTDEEGQLVRIDYGERIYYDATRGIAGTTYPIGTPGMPSNTIANAITLLGLRNLKALDVHGAVTIAVDVNHKDFFGNYHESVADIVTLAAGNDVDDSHFKGLIITGAQGGTGFATYKECMLLNMTGFRGLAENCALYGTLAIATGAADYADFDHCTSVHGVITVTIGDADRVSFKEFSGGMILTAQAAGSAVYVRGISGYLEVDAMAGGTLDIYAHGADIQINANCAAGTINIYGDARVTVIAGATATINDYTINTKLAGLAPVEGTVTANWNTAAGTSGEAGEDLLGGASVEGAIGAPATRYKVHSLLLDVIALTDGAKIHVKLFIKVNGNERKVYDQEFTVPATVGPETAPPDTLGLWIVNGTIAIHDELRVEVYSDTNENVAIGFTYMLEEM